jgi:16S rRNA (guanine527-N7)-methyltransferase
MCAQPTDPVAVAFRTTLETALVSLGVSLTDEAFNQLVTHYISVVDLNRSLNLTRITAPDEAAVKHYADSLVLVAALPEIGVEVHRVLDVGTGAGFPAVPLAVARPDWAVTAIDATAKKTRAVELFARQLGLPNLDVQHARCEDFAAAGRAFDLICFRAVGAIDQCLRMGRRLLNAGGAVVCWKTADLKPEELRVAGREARKLGFTPLQQFCYEIVGLDRPRRLQLVWSRLM